MTETVAPTRSGLLWVGRTAALGLLLAACAGAYWLGSSTGGALVPNAGLSVEDKYLNFGEVWEQKAFTWELPITNSTSKEVKVVKLVSSCVCQEVAPETLVVPPGGQKKVRLTLDLTYASQAQRQGDWRDFEARIFPIIDGVAPQQPGWIVKGVVRVALNATPRTVDFGKQLISGKSGVSETIKLTAHPSVARLKVVVDPMLGVVVHQTNDKPKEFCLEVLPQVTLRPGQFQFDMRVEPTGPGEEVLPPLTIPVNGFVLDDIEAVGAPVRFGVKRIGESVSEVILLRSRTGQQLDVHNINVQGGGIDVEENLVSGKDTQSFRITRRVSERGLQHAEIIFHIVGSRDRISRTVIVPVSYYGSAYLSAPQRTPDIRRK